MSLEIFYKFRFFTRPSIFDKSFPVGFSTKIYNFSDKPEFSTKNVYFRQNWIFDKNFYFWQNWIFGKNVYFLTKLNFRQKISIFDKTGFSTKVSIFEKKNVDFWQKKSICTTFLIFENSTIVQFYKFLNSNQNSDFRILIFQDLEIFSMVAKNTIIPV